MFPSYYPSYVVGWPRWVYLPTRYITMLWVGLGGFSSYQVYNWHVVGGYTTTYWVVSQLGTFLQFFVFPFIVLWDKNDKKRFVHQLVKISPGLHVQSFVGQGSSVKPVFRRIYIIYTAWFISICLFHFLTQIRWKPGLFVK